MPRKSAVDAPPYLDGVKNRVPGNEGLAQHARSVFEEVVENLVNKGAMIDIIGIEDGAVESVEYVQSNWEKWKGRVQAIAIGTSFPLMTELWNKQFLQFWGKVRWTLILIWPLPMRSGLSSRNDADATGFHTTARSCLSAFG